MNKPCPKCGGRKPLVCGTCGHKSRVCTKCKGRGFIRITYGNVKILKYLFEHWERLKNISHEQIYSELCEAGLYSKDGHKFDYCLSIQGYKKRIRSYLSSKKDASELFK